ncbi:MAG: hypothetical protein NVSMB4_16650 [Acidimicrobiales bacterium]
MFFHIHTHMPLPNAGRGSDVQASAAGVGGSSESGTSREGCQGPGPLSGGAGGAGGGGQPTWFTGPAGRIGSEATIGSGGAGAGGAGGATGAGAAGAALAVVVETGDSAVVTDTEADGSAATRAAIERGDDWTNAVPTPARPTADTTATIARNVFIDGPSDAGLGIPWSRFVPAGKWYRGAQPCERRGDDRSRTGS